MSEHTDVRVTQGFGTYTARAGGRTASCTSSAALAVERLAGKLAAGRFWRVDKAGPHDSRASLWRITWRGAA